VGGGAIGVAAACILSDVIKTVFGKVACPFDPDFHFPHFPWDNPSPTGSLPNGVPAGGTVYTQADGSKVVDYGDGKDVAVVSPDGSWKWSSRTATPPATFIVTSASGTNIENIIRTTTSNGVNFQFNTGHSFYRSHNSASGTTDLRLTTLTADGVETAIVHDILAYLKGGGVLPSGGRGAIPMNRTVNVNGYSLTYRIVQTTPVNINIATYFLN